MEPRIMLVAVELLGCGSLEEILADSRVLDVARRMGVRIIGGVPAEDGLGALFDLLGASAPPIRTRSA